MAQLLAVQKEQEAAISGVRAADTAAAGAEFDADVEGRLEALKNAGVETEASEEEALRGAAERGASQLQKTAAELETKRVRKRVRFGDDQVRASLFLLFFLFFIPFSILLPLLSSLNFSSLYYSSSAFPSHFFSSFPPLQVKTFDDYDEDEDAAGAANDAASCDAALLGALREVVAEDLEAAGRAALERRLASVDDPEERERLLREFEEQMRRMRDAEAEQREVARRKMRARLEARRRAAELRRKDAGTEADAEAEEMDDEEFRKKVSRTSLL